MATVLIKNSPEQRFCINSQTITDEARNLSKSLKVEAKIQV